MIKSILGGAFAALVITAAPAAAATVTFTPLISPSAGTAGDGTTYLENGLTFTSSIASSNALYHWGSSDSVNADAGGATLFQNFPSHFITVTATGGGSFTLNSFDLADAYNAGGGGSVAFSWTDGSGTSTSFLALDNAIGLQTFTFNYTGVTSFSLQQEAPYFQVDNIVFNEATNAVPEPATWALMIAGFGLVGAAMRRRALAAA